VEPDETADVAIVGYGPTGQVLSILLAQRGWNVTVLEKWPQPYPMPRAVSVDGYAARVLATAGISEAISEFGVPGADYIVQNAAGETLLRLVLSSDDEFGPPRSTSIYQPGLEQALARRGEQLSALRVRRGQEVVQVADHGDGASLRTRNVVSGESSTLSARWVVGCDGARSVVRDQIGTTVTDLNFTIDWMACDLVPHRLADFPPANTQVADPTRPRVAATAGPRHRRWEFMRLASEPLESFSTEANAWRLLELFGVGRDQAELERYAVYTLAARNADRWRRGRILIAGDAAHQMPPFAGQGMCSGIADAANLAWKLDRVLNGAPGDLLDSYQRERQPDAQRAIEASVQLGRLICQTDPVAAAHRDHAMIGRARNTANRAQAAPIPAVRPAPGGFHHVAGDGTPGVGAGQLLPPIRVRTGGTAASLDDQLGIGFSLLLRQKDVLGPEAGDRLDEAGVRVVHVLSPDDRAATEAGTVVDVDGTLTGWLDSIGATAVLLRPDRYVYGTAVDSAGLTELARSFLAQLPARPTVRA